MAISGQIDRRENTNRYELRNRYVFSGQLEMKTALHIGGGKITLSSSDSPVVLTPEQQPFIPGSNSSPSSPAPASRVRCAAPSKKSCRAFPASRRVR